MTKTYEFWHILRCGEGPLRARKPGIFWVWWGQPIHRAYIGCARAVQEALTISLSAKRLQRGDLRIKMKGLVCPNVSFLATQRLCEAGGSKRQAKPCLQERCIPALR